VTARKGTAAAVKRPKTVEIAPPELDVEPIEDGPVIVGKEGKTGAELVRHDLFEVDGVMYSMPEPTIGHVLKYLKHARKAGNLQAAQDIGFDLLGEEALDALANSPDASERDVERIWSRVGKLFFGSSAYKSVTGTSGN